ncbi:MAG: hydrogen gas-evolving membrane-bound hydrogenase subunit E [Anaerolineae bacterium]
MALAIINFVPFLMAIFGMTPLNKLLPKPARAWLSAGVMLALFIGLISYFPQLQTLDETYKAQQGIVSEYESESTTTEAVDTGDTPAVDPVTDETTLYTNAIIEEFAWVPELGLTLSFYLDGLSLLFGLIVTGIGALIFLYAGYYFDDEQQQSQFITILFAFAGAMLGLVLSGNLITLFIMWELTSITSYLLIGFKGNKYEDARFGATQAFLVTGVGALALIVGFVILALITGDVTGNGIFNFNMVEILQADPQAIGAHPLYVGALILIVLGAFTKSAQFPFHFWLPGAMAAPTPASAYLHSATMVKAGVYLLLRLYPAMHTNILWTQVLVTVGIGTMFIAAFIALWQRDLKGLLAYSTVSWLGALVGMIGLPESAGIKAALVGIIAHALYKAALFLSAGTIDHNTGTRIIDNLGGLRKQMPIIAVVVVISCLSMAGVPIFFGFVAKEVLLDVWLEEAFVGQQLSYWLLCISAALTGTVGFIFIWDVFFKEPTEDIHFHASSIWLSIPPLVLAIGSTIFGLFLDPPLTFMEDIVAIGTPKAIDIHLLPSTITNPIFLTSIAIVATGFVVFLARQLWLPILSKLPLPRTTDIYQGLLGLTDWIGDQVVKTQNGQVRYYLIVIMGTVGLAVLSTGVVTDLAIGEPVVISMGDLTAATALRAILLLLIVLAAFYSVIVRSHLTAVLALGVLGYAVGGMFLIEPAPDVSLVQFLIETMATVLVIVMLGRISKEQRADAMNKLWKGNTLINGFNIGLVRDIIIAVTVGLAVFFFSLTALVNRPDRESISIYHLENTAEQVGIEDVVGAIVADYRGMDTFVEIFVFGVAALGVLTILTRGYEQTSPLVPNPKKVSMQSELTEQSIDQVQDATSLNTPFTRMVARIVLPLAFLISISHIINGVQAPGDGFTAGAVAGLVTALWYVIFGYEDAKERLKMFQPHRLLRAGLTIAMINSIVPIIFGLYGGTFHEHVDYGSRLGINDILHRFGLELTSGFFFEIGIALTVFGGLMMITEAIAHPADIPDIDELTQTNE